jgi:hypothetical protein
MRPLFDDLQDHELLTAEECAAARAAVHDLRPHWVRREPWVPFFTLGAASYLDARHKREENYHAPARRLNPLLRERFGWLYDRLADRLSALLGAPVVYRPGCALPGFHIFQWCAAFEQPFASVHQDLQYELLAWGPDERPDLRNPLSFTLAVALPRTGGGLNVWDVAHDELEGLPGEERRRLIASRRRDYHPYRAGRIAVHSGHKVHQIAPGRDTVRGEERLTLQGHGVRCSGVWHLYW